LIVGSEPLNPGAVHRMMAQLPDLRITNGYGPTEATIGMVFHPVTAGDGDAIPLGRPIDNCYATVLDADMRTVPPGTTGEIVIGGQGGVKSLALFDSGHGLAEGLIAEGLRRTLPRVSVPRYYFLLESMPLPPNGKVDRDALQETLDARLAEDAARLAENAH